MAPIRQGLPLPDYLQGKTYDDRKERHIKGAVYIVENGRLSNQPCRLCVANNKDCIVDPTRSSRCAWCSFKSMKNRECRAEGVKPFQTWPGESNAQHNNTPSQNAQVRHKGPQPSILTPPASADFKNPDSVRHAVTATRAMAILDSKKVYSEATHDPKQKRKRHIADPNDAPKSATKRTRPTVTEPPYAPTAPKPEAQGPFFTPINVPTTTPDEPPTAIEHHHPPTATGAAKATVPNSAPATDLVTVHSAHLVDTEQSPEPTEGEIIGHIIVRVQIPVVKEDLGDLEALPFNRIECDHNMRTEDPQGWARWANALHTEINSLNHVSDVGPLTNNLIAMMVKDGVWPGPISNTAAQEE